MQGSGSSRQDQSAALIEAQRLNFAADHDPVEISAGLEDEVILEAVPMLLDLHIHARVESAVADRSIAGDVRAPSGRIVPEEVVVATGERTDSLDDDVV